MGFRISKSGMARAAVHIAKGFTHRAVSGSADLMNLVRLNRARMRGLWR
jgi:hypothetical protein